MLYRFLCNGVKREGVKFSSDLTSGLFCYVPLHKFWYGIVLGVLLEKQKSIFNKVRYHMYPGRRGRISLMRDNVSFISLFFVASAFQSTFFEASIARSTKASDCRLM